MKSLAKKAVLGHLAVTAMALGAAGAAAGPIGTVEFDLRNTLFPFGYDGVRVHFNDGNTQKSVSVHAGTFGAVARDSDGLDDGFDPSTLYRNQGDVLLYCVDLLDNLIRTPTIYNVYNVAQDEVLPDATSGAPRRDFARMFDFLGAVNSVMTKRNLGSSGDENWLEPGTGWLAGAIQVGIWESLYEQSGSPLALTGADSGWFSVTGIGDGSQNLTVDGDDFLKAAFLAMSGEDDLDASKVKRFVPTDANGEINRQELIGDPVPVPAPASLLLTLSGLGLLISRRRNG